MIKSNNDTIISYRDLTVWKKGLVLVKEIYLLTDQFPKSELYGLTSQMRRSSISIPSNIAEGKMRGTRKDYRHFLLHSFSSGAELETQIEIVKQLPFGVNLNYNNVSMLLEEIMKMLNVLVRKLK